MGPGKGAVGASDGVSYENGGLVCAECALHAAGVGRGLLGGRGGVFRAAAVYSDFGSYGRQVNDLLREVQ